ncbi:unnamed protein product [Lasius platythorax]|uniref:Uncharacterized protein n=1 Tax=Lasius platythorax TaxID=488582 RepID=A0AAV2NNY3_9HYME
MFLRSPMVAVRISYWADLEGRFGVVSHPPARLLTKCRVRYRRWTAHGFMEYKNCAYQRHRGSKEEVTFRKGKAGSSVARLGS